MCRGTDLTAERSDKPWSRQRDLGLVIFAYCIGILVSFPPAALIFHQPPRFIAWFDQGRYLRSAAALLHGNLDPQAHWYPLLYPLLLAPLAWAPPLLEAALPDLACYVLTYLGVRSIARRLGITPRATVVVFLLSTIAWPGTGDDWIMPWTTTPTAALLWLLLALCAAILDPAEAQNKSVSLHRLIGLGAVAGAIPLCRPADLAVAAVAIVVILPALWQKGGWRAFATIAAAALAVLLCGLGLHLAIYGARPSDYMLLSAAYGTNLGQLGWKAYVILIEPKPWYPEGAGLLARLPWLPLGAAGIGLALAQRASRPLALLLVLPALIYLAIMLAYVDFLPSGLWKFGNSHYFKWLTPIFGLFAWRFASKVHITPRASVVTLALVLVPTTIHLTPVLAAPDQPARMVTFAPVASSFNTIYFGRSTLDDRLGSQRAVFDFHPVPVAIGADGAGVVHAQALRRDFAGGEVWHAPASPALWPPLAPGQQVPTYPRAFTRKPLARYRPAIALGWPCWLPPYACPASLP